LAEYLFSESIYTLKLRLKGISLQQGRDLDVMQGITVQEAMTTPPYVVDLNMPLQELDRWFQETHGHSFPVVDGQNHLVGMVSISDYDRALAEDSSNNRMVADIATIGKLLLAYQDEPLSDALQRIATRGVNKLPVVTRAEPRNVVGVIRRRDIVRAYNTALVRRARDQASQDQMRLRHIDNTEFLEIEILDGSSVANRAIASLADLLPRECVIVSVRRQGIVLIPHGDTILQAGDLVNFFLRQDDEEQLRNCLENND
jgi:CIC family chloride channel protein